MLAADADAFAVIRHNDRDIRVHTIFSFALMLAKRSQSILRAIRNITKWMISLRLQRFLASSVVFAALRVHDIQQLPITIIIVTCLNDSTFFRFNLDSTHTREWFWFCLLHNFNSFARFNQLFCVQKWTFSHETVALARISMGNNFSVAFLYKEGTVTYCRTHLTNSPYQVHWKLIKKIVLQFQLVVKTSKTQNEIDSFSFLSISAIYFCHIFFITSF